MYATKPLLMLKNVISMDRTHGGEKKWLNFIEAISEGQIRKSEDFYHKDYGRFEI